MNAAVNPITAPAEGQLIKLDIGCGKNKQAGFTGMDQYAMEGVDVVHNVNVTPWPFADESVGQVYSAHFLEHLEQGARVKFFNELYRVMAWGATAHIQTPNWAHACAYGDPTHKWPPPSEWYALYLQKAWRDQNAPHADVAWNSDGYSCDFDWGSSGTWDIWLNLKHEEAKVFWMQRGVNSCRDLIINLTKTKRS